MKAGNSAIASQKSIMIIAATERQAFLLSERVLAQIYQKNKTLIKKGKDKPTKKRLKLINGSVIHCLPTGDTGYGIRGFTIDELYADEAHFIKEEVWAAVTPMLATTGGTINLLSTPFGTEGYFYRAFHDPKFTSIHVNTENVARGRQDPQKTHMLEFLKDEKLRMTKLQYQQEYLGLFVGGIQRFFPDDLIDQCCILPVKSLSGGELYQGIDIARMGGDETVLVTLKKIGDMLRQVDMEIPEGQKLTDTARLIISKDAQFHHKKIYIDDGGMGVGVYDILYEHFKGKKVVAINNAKRSFEKQRINKRTKERKTSLLKTDLYNNLKNLMEYNKIKLFNDPALRQSLRSIQYENTEGVLKIYGNYSHIAEALIRAAWCVKDKHLKLWVRSLKEDGIY